MEDNNGWGEWSKHVLHELDRLNNCVGNIEDKIQCEVHTKAIKDVEKKINWLILAFMATIIGGIVLGLWMRTIIP